MAKGPCFLTLCAVTCTAQLPCEVLLAVLCVTSANYSANMLAISADKEVQDASFNYIEQHGLTPLFREVMEACLVSRPTAPIPFIMDCFQLGPGKAVQDQELGIAVWRRDELQNLYASIVQVSRVAHRSEHV